MIGTALESWEGSFGRLILFVRPGWHAAPSERSAQRRGQLVDGSAWVAWPAGFDGSRALAGEVHVDLTPIGARNELWLGHIDSTGFEVRAGGTTGVFSWRASL